MRSPDLAYSTLGIHNRSPRVRSAVGALALATLLSACNAPEQVREPLQHEPSAGASASSRPAKATVRLIPNMKGFLDETDDSKCYGGGPRPCAPQIRSAPTLKSAKINVDPAHQYVAWPLERYTNPTGPYKGTPGNAVVVRCYTSHSQAIHPYEPIDPHASPDNQASTEWYAVEVPEEYALDGVPLHPSLRPKTEYRGKVAIGWASVEWFATLTHDRAVGQCDPIAN